METKSQNKKVLFLGDSLGLPRPNRSVLAHQTWCHLTHNEFKNKNMDFFYYLTGGAHTRSIFWMRKEGYLSAYDPDIIILQVGIVDCASRVLGEGTVKIISILPIINVLIKKFIKKFHKPLQRLRNITYVRQNEFRKNLEALKSLFNGAEFIVIPIAPASNDYIDFMPKISENIKTYNSILEDVFPKKVLSNVYKQHPIEHLILDDYHHLSIGGHKVVSSEVCKRLNGLLD